MTANPLHWDLTNFYQDLKDPLLQADFQALDNETTALQAYFEQELKPLSGKAAEPADLAERLGRLLDRLNALLLQAGKIRAYLTAIVDTDSFNKEAEQMLSSFSIATLPLNNFSVGLRKWIGSIRGQLPAALALEGTAKAHSFYLLEQAEQSKYMMSEAEEVLANELNLSGGRAWHNLQGVLTSQKTVPFELDGEQKILPMPALINLRSHPNPEVRERAYYTEMSVWEELKEPLAACLNSIKGETNTLARKRGRPDALHASLEASRIDRETLEAMIGAIEDSLPVFRSYFKAKARLLGQDKLPWWSLFAPLGKTETTFSFDMAADLIVENFHHFTPELAGFARKAFDRRWIDAEQRPGKRGGAYCMGITALRESRILCNFDGSLDQVMTIAHELGHAFHNECEFQANKTDLQTRTPMTLAETASIMNETIMFHALRERAGSRDEELALLETKIGGDAQVIVDILSRFYFEREVFERRLKSTLSADEICEVMLQAQHDSYGDGLDPEVLNKFAWTWKPHYYSTGFAFYNYPYAFGLLFGTGLYAIFKERGAAFVPEYKALLANTGSAQAADLAAGFGIDIRSKAFWQTSLYETAKLVERYVTL